MPENYIPMDQDTKHKIWGNLSLKYQDFKKALTELALKGIGFPAKMLKLTLLQQAYQAHDNNTIKKFLADAIKEYMESVAAKEFIEFFREEIGRGNLYVLPSQLMRELNNEDKFKFVEKPLVELTIKEGKIHWRFVRMEYHTPIVIERTGKNTGIQWNNTIKLTWDAFKIIKNTGKRGGTTPISKESFCAKFPNDINLAQIVWEELKEIGILDKKNLRLTSAWRVITKQHVLLNSLQTVSKRITHQEVANALYELSTSDEPKNYGNNFCNYRPERTKKTWDESGYITNQRAATNDLFHYRMWDVEIYRRLTALTQKKDKDDDLKTNNDHIPSSSKLSDYQRNEKLEPKEFKSHWWTIVIPERLHRQGLSYVSRQKKQYVEIKNPFHDEVAEYLNILRYQLHHGKILSNFYLEALGAFRYMLRCQLKEPKPIKDINCIGKAPYAFFNSNKSLVKKIDKLINDNLREHIQEKERSVVGFYTG